MLDHYLSQPADTMFDDVNHCEYYEEFMVSNTLPTENWRDQVPDHQMYMYRRLKDLQDEQTPSRCGRQVLSEAPLTSHCPKIFPFSHPKLLCKHLDC